MSTKQIVVSIDDCNGEPMVVVYNDGSVWYAPNANVDDAAKRFYEAIADLADDLDAAAARVAKKPQERIQ